MSDGSIKYGWPNPDIDPEEKGFDYDVRCCQAAVTEYENGEYGISPSAVDDIANARLYMEGNQATDKYLSFQPKDDQGNSISFLDLPISPIGLMKKFIRLMKANIQDSVGTVSLKAYDQSSIEERETLAAMQKVYMNAGIQKLSKAVGLPIPNTVPRNELEANIYKMMGIKIGVEVAAETMINTVMRDNDYQDMVIPDMVEDLLCGNIAAIHTYTDTQGRIKKKVIKPEQLIVSASQSRNYEDSRVKGYWEDMPLWELKEITSGLFSEEQYLQMAAEAGNDPGMLDRTPGDYYDGQAYSYDNFKVRVHKLYYVDTDHYVKERKYLEDKPGEFVYRRRKHKWNPTSRQKDRVVVSVTKVREAMYVKGMKCNGFVWDNGVMKNILRDDDKRPIIPIRVVRVGRHSINLSVSMATQLSRIEDPIQAAWNRMMNSIAQAKDPNIAVNVHSILAGMDVVSAKSVDEVLNSYLLGNPLPVGNTDTYGTNAAGNPVIPIPAMNAIGEYLNAVSSLMSIMQEVSGAASVAAASQPNPNLLNGVAGMAMAQSLKVLRDHQSAARKIIKEDAEITELYLKKVIQQEDKFGDGYYKEMFSTAGRSVLMAAKNIPNRRLNIFVEVGMSEEDIQQFSQFVYQSVSKRDSTGKGGLRWDIALQLLDDFKRNKKLAIYRLRYELNKQDEDDQKRAMALQAQAGQMQAQQAQAGMQAGAAMKQAEQESKLAEKMMSEEAATKRVIISSIGKLMDSDSPEDKNFIELFKRMASGALSPSERQTVDTAISQMGGQQ